MENCKQKSKVANSTNNTNHYVFECNDNDGNSKIIEIDAEDDLSATTMAELECMYGKDLFTDEDRLEILEYFDFNNLKSEAEKELNNAVIASNKIVLDPKKSTRLAQYGATGLKGCEIKMSGKWIPGERHPAWGPKGSDTDKYRGTNKWCVLILVYFENDLKKVLPWALVRGSTMRIGSYGFPTTVMAVMNDDRYEDNINEVGNPMTATVNLF